MKHSKYIQSTCPVPESTSTAAVKPASQSTRSNMPSSTAIVYRVSYRREGWRDGVWKNKLFNSEGAATKYAAHLQQPVTAATPDKFRELKPVTVQLSFGMTRWAPLDATDALIDVREGNYKDGWTTALRAVKALKERIAPNDPEPTLAECIAFAAAMEEE